MKPFHKHLKKYVNKSFNTFCFQKDDKQVGTKYLLNVSFIYSLRMNTREQNYVFLIYSNEIENDYANTLALNW